MKYLPDYCGDVPADLLVSIVCIHCGNEPRYAKVSTPADFWASDITAMCLQCGREDRRSAQWVPVSGG